MGSVRKLAHRVEEGLKQALPTLRKTISRKLALAVAAIIEARTANTAVIANLLPLATEEPDNRQQWMRRLLKNELMDCPSILEPFAQTLLKELSGQGQTLCLSMDQTEIGSRFAVLMISVRVGDRALPLAWHAEGGEANIGWGGQQILLERVKTLLPAPAEVLFLADRFYPSARLILWLKKNRWHYRLRLKGNLTVDIGNAEVTTTGELLRKGMKERYCQKARLFESGVETHIGVLHEAAHPEPWIMAMDAKPNKAAVLDYGVRWSIEPMFSDFKTRGFGLANTRLLDPERLERLILIMALAMYWCVRTGRKDAEQTPTDTEKRAAEQPLPNHWSARQLYRSMLSWFTRGLRLLLRRAQNDGLIPAFYSSA